MIFHTSASSADLYLAVPPVSLHVAPLVYLGTGMRIFTFVANCLSLKHDRTLTSTWMRVRPSSFTSGMSLNGREMPSVTRYFIRSNLPSGGTNDIVFSLANFDRLTH